jgi:hypothetical protein
VFPLGLLGSETGADPFDPVGRHGVGLGQPGQQRANTGLVVVIRGGSCGFAGSDQGVHLDAVVSGGVRGRSGSLGSANGSWLFAPTLV